MKLQKVQAGKYDIIHNGELFGQISDGRKFNLYDTNGLWWKIYCIDTDNRLHKQGFSTLKEAKRKLGL